MADSTEARIEDLEEALRRITLILSPDGRHDVTERDLAALAFAADVLGLDAPAEPKMVLIQGGGTSDRAA